MQSIVFYLIIAVFCALLCFNFYYKQKVMHLHKELTKKNIDFSISHIVHTHKLEKEILPRYMKDQDLILEFVSKVRHSIAIAVSVLLLITLLSCLYLYV